MVVPSVSTTLSPATTAVAVVASVEDAVVAVVVDVVASVDVAAVVASADVVVVAAVAVVASVTVAVDVVVAVVASPARRPPSKRIARNVPDQTEGIVHSHSRAFVGCRLLKT